MTQGSQLRFPVKRMEQRFVTRLAALLALAMTVADLSGRARVLDEAEAAMGKRPRPRIGLSFADPMFADDATILAPAELAPDEALLFSRQRIGMTRRAFDRLQTRYRELAFTVANVESVELIETIQKKFDQALAQGQTRDWFIRESNAALRAAGVSELSPFHLETVLATNANTAYQAGRAHQMLQADVRRALPWWQYRTVGDSRVRPAHRAMHGFLARWDDPVWKKWYPPAGYRCRCSVFALSDAEARRRGKDTGQDLSIAGGTRAKVEPDEGFSNSPWAALSGRLDEGRN